MQNLLQHAHSGLRWIALLLIVITIVKAFSGMTGNKPFTSTDKKLALFTLISFHLQLVIGLFLYVRMLMLDNFNFAASMKDPLSRFFSVEHITAMLIAIALVTIGNAKSKKGATDKAKFKSLAVFFTLALVIVLAMIPWPCMTKFANYSHWF